MYWRKETYGLRAPRRFKITNFAPAIEGSALITTLTRTYLTLLPYSAKDRENKEMFNDKRM